MKRQKPVTPAVVEEQQPQHGGSFVRQPDGTLEVIEQTVLTGPGDAPADADDADEADPTPATADGATDPPAPIDPDPAIDPDAAKTEEA